MHLHPPTSRSSPSGIAFPTTTASGLLLLLVVRNSASLNQLLDAKHVGIFTRMPLVSPPPLLLLLHDDLGVDDAVLASLLRFLLLLLLPPATICIKASCPLSFLRGGSSFCIKFLLTLVH